jgi:hypothetical protein
MDDRLRQRMKERKNKDENSISQLLLIHNTWKQNPHSPLMKHVPHMCKMKAKMKVKWEAKMTIEVQN